MPYLIGVTALTAGTRGKAAVRTVGVTSLYDLGDVVTGCEEGFNIEHVRSTPYIQICR